MQKLRHLLIFIVGVSVPFNNVGFSMLGRSWSLGLLASALYLLSMLPELSKTHSMFKYYGKFIGTILVFAILLTFINMLNVNGYGTPVCPTTLFLCCFLFYMMLLHDKIDNGVLRILMSGIAVGSILMSIFFFLGIGIEIGEDSRLMMFGENSNALGIYMCLAWFIILNNWLISKKLRFKCLKVVVILCLIPITILLFATGSRVAFISFVSAILIFLLFLKTRKILNKIIIWLFSLCTFPIIYGYMLDSNSIMLERMTTTIEDGNTSGRDDIFSELWPHVIENIFHGVGQTGYVDIAKESIGKVSIIGGITYGYSPHNVIVEILIYTGVGGLLLWLIFWSKCIKLSICSFRMSYNILPLLFLIPIFGCVLSAQILTSKWAYIIYAYIITEGVKNKSSNKSMIPF